MKTLILGMGNTLVGDDGVGIHAARAAVHRLTLEEAMAVDMEETAETYFVLLDYVDRYDRIIVVDAMIANAGDEGRVRVLDAGEFPSSASLSLSHGARPGDVLHVAQAGSRGPAPQVVFVTIGVRDAFRLGEQLSERAAAAVDEAAAVVANLARRGTRTALHSELEMLPQEIQRQLA